MEYTIENLKATVESTGQTVTGRLIFTQVLVRHQIVHFSLDINRKMSKMAWIPRFECNEPLEIIDDMFTKVVVPKIGFWFNAYAGCNMLIGAEGIGELPGFVKEVSKDADL
jgi:hypothetical protein